MSLLAKKWVAPFIDPELEKVLQDGLSLSRLISKILISRGVLTLKEAQDFLKPTLFNLTSPFDISQMTLAVKRVLLARERDEKVLVFGDYDADGVTSTALLVEMLRRLDIKADYYIPHRYSEGYGLNLAAVKRAHELGVALLITVDCGITNHDEIKEANLLGMDTIVTDHHLPPEKLPAAFAVINPKLNFNPDHPAYALAGVGVAFKFAWAILRMVNAKDEVIKDFLDLVALGTIADMVPLTGENRILSYYGLKRINRRGRKGIAFLIEAASLKGWVSSRDIGFMLAPRINAAGRLQHADLSLKTLLTKEPEEARKMALDLQKINTSRQKKGALVEKEVLKEISLLKEELPPVLLFASHDWHPGVIGIVASQISRRFFKPTILISFVDGVGRGSVRSIPGLNIYEVLAGAKGLLLDFGGHSQAAGFEIKEDNLEIFKRRITEGVELKLSEITLLDEISWDFEILPQEIDLKMIRSLKVLEPFGQGNPEPLFLSRALRLVRISVVGKGKSHLKLKFSDGKTLLDLIGFGLNSLSDKLNLGKYYDVIYGLSEREWEGKSLPQLRLVDLRETEKI